MAEEVKDLIERGRVEIKEGKWEKASIVLSKAIGIIDGSKADDDMKVLLSEALSLNAFAHTRMGDFHEAVSDARRAMEVSMTVKDLKGEADALRRLGYVHWRKGDNTLSMEFYHNAIEKAAAGGADRLLGRTLIEMGSLHVSMKEFPKAERLFKQAIDIMTKEGMMEEVARAYNNLGSCYMDSGEFEKAVPTFEECIMISEAAEDPLHKGWGAFNMADCLTQMGRPEEAIPLLDMALKIMEDLNDLLGLSATYLASGKTYNALKEWDRAEEDLNRTLELLKETTVPEITGQALQLLGENYLGRGDKERGRKELQKALESYEAVDNTKDAEKVRKILEGL